nr:hypothetical protein [Patescibacteria group bacterium]
MLSLHDATELTKNIAKWVGLAIAAIFVGVLLYRGVKLIMTTFFPKPPPPPKVAFGKLPPLLFPPNASNIQFIFQIDTVSGGLGNFPDRENVYKTIPSVPSLLDLQTARNLLSGTPFIFNERPLTDTVYTWTDSSRPDKMITYNIVSEDFTITSDYPSYTDLDPLPRLDRDAALTSAQNFLQNLNLYPLDLDDNKTSIQLLSLEGTKVVAASSLSTAQLARIDFFQKNLNKLPIVYPNPPYSTMHFLLGGTNSTEILEGKFDHQAIDTLNTTYPIKTPQQAYD